jgi:hypothetical protein
MFVGNLVYQIPHYNNKIQRISIKTNEDMTYLCTSLYIQNKSIMDKIINMIAILGLAASTK